MVLLLTFERGRSRDFDLVIGAMGCTRKCAA